MNTEAISYAQSLTDAWNEFVDKHGIYFAEMHTENADKIGKAYMAGWITGIGSINANA